MWVKIGVIAGIESTTLDLDSQSGANDLLTIISYSLCLQDVS